MHNVNDFLLLPYLGCRGKKTVKSCRALTEGDGHEVSTAHSLCTSGFCTSPCLM